MIHRLVPLPDLSRRVSGETTPPRMWLLAVVAIGLGLAGGGAALALFKLIGLISHLVLLHDVGFSLPTLRGYHPSPVIIVTAVIGGLLVSALAIWSPVIRGHGIPESLEAILIRESRIPLRAAIAKPLSAAIAIGTGGPFGAEGPIIVTGGSIGSLIGQLIPVSPAERKILLATGAAAGMSATFNAPLASVILAIELLLFERSLRTIVPVAIASAFAAAVRVLAFGPTPLFAIHGHLSVSLPHLPLFIVVGLAAGLLAVVLNKGLFAIEAGFRRLPVSMLWWPAIGAVGFAVIGIFVPRSLSVGYSAISDTLNGHFALAALGALFVAKLFSWWISLASQTSGGTLAPMFLIGATMGGLLGDGFAHAWPGLHVSPAAFALVAMGATFGAAAKAPFTGVVFAFEVTGQYHMVIPLMVGVAVAELVAQLFLEDRIMTEKLSHRGFRVDFDVEVDVLRQRVVRQVMREPIALSAGTSVADAADFATQSGAAAMAVVDDDGRYVGLVRSSALGVGEGRAAARVGVGEPITVDAALRPQPRPGDGAHPAAASNGAGGSNGAGTATIASLAAGDLRPLAPGEFLLTALTYLIDEDLDSLPVVEGGRVIGQLGRVDVAAQRLERHTSFEAVQPGQATVAGSWLRARATRAIRTSRPGGSTGAGGGPRGGPGGGPAAAAGAGQAGEAVTREERDEARAELTESPADRREEDAGEGHSPAPSTNGAQEGD